MEGHKPHKFECFPFFIKSKNVILHYTCNSPSLRILRKYGIKPVGTDFGCANEREVLEIPLVLYNKKGFYEVDDKNILQINLERLMTLS